LGWGDAAFYAAERRGLLSGGRAVIGWPGVASRDGGCREHGAPHWLTKLTARSGDSISFPVPLMNDFCFFFSSSIYFPSIFELVFLFFKTLSSSLNILSLS